MKTITLVFLAATLPSSAVTLVRGGKPACSIVLPRGASPSMQRGAEELQRFLAEMSGAQIPMAEDARGTAIRLQSTDELGPEGFRLKTEGRNLVIAGGRERGVMYGVYTLLEKLGCRWFSPEVSRIPKRTTITIGTLDEVQKPAFEYREPFFTEAFDKDWAARNKTNGAHQKLDASTGGRIEYFPFVHSFYSMIPPDKFFKDHPEYFSLIDGKRRVERGQLCLTNPDVLRVGVEAVERWIAQHPEATILSVSQNDWTGWCECDNCRRVEQEEGGVHSGPILRYVNALAAEIEKRHPDKLIDTLAYWYTEAPPAKERPRKNVRIRLCPIGVCEAHPYEKCDRSAYFMNNLRAWSKITDQLYIWHYNTNFAHYLLPFPDFDELAANLPMYKQHGVVGVFLEGAYPDGGGGENAELRSYVMAKLLWDTRVDANKLVDEFLDGVYGKAAPAMRAYFDLMHRQVRFPPQGLGHHLWIFQNPNTPYLSGDFLPRAKEIFRKAEAAADDEAVRRRVRKARLPIDYLELMRAKQFEVRGAFYQPADLGGLKDRFQTFLDQARGFGMGRVHESRDLKEDEREFDRMMKPYRVWTLENDALRAQVAPELSGRVIRLVDKRSGADLLRRGDPGERGYPDAGGLGVWVYPDFYGRVQDVAWKLESSDADEIRLAGTTANGLQLARRLWLEGAALRTATTVENGAGEPRDVALQSRADYGPGLNDDPSLRLSWAGTEKILFEPGKETSGVENYTGADVPDGAWSAFHLKAPVRLVNRFSRAQSPRASMNWSVRGENRVTLTLWSEQRKLAPGEKLEFATDYAVEPYRPPTPVIRTPAR